VHFLEDEHDNEGNEICVAEWVKKHGGKLISCSFLKPNEGRRDEMRYAFDVSKCGRLFDLLLRGGVIRLTEGHEHASQPRGWRVEGECLEKAG
jgi:hypothetical protein